MSAIDSIVSVLAGVGIVVLLFIAVVNSEEELPVPQTVEYVEVVSGGQSWVITEDNLEIDWDHDRYIITLSSGKKMSLGICYTNIYR